MAKKVIITEDARKDLDRIFLDFSDYSEKYAQLWADEFFKYIDLLEVNPKMGRIVPEINSENFREVFVGKYRMIYKVTQDVEIMMLRHSAKPLNL
ncbi:type II toxin-antitoxin system RelE/ParE family toxin [Arcicella sp. LKC2W]|jgi:toxin ParE1/3/4|uniref:type II toxin-antitoxin system RelE/ParE family toxin n=1 Tax=Arcicella sp. LKC2W TaxID=2984198 RepID=UPI002B221656|nr:type II toxin-antitoxin system RelE/ParE family toxin [Arcicella sp. LKC2W]MEA5458156.1 type II toxin-antitoxin system RelE/ParE family toxin [Arcicella sp. LKC2W]